MKTVLGVGLLALPFAMQQAGYLLGFFVLIIIALLTLKSLDSVMQIAENIDLKLTY